VVMAHVTDADSTPEQDDVASVTAELTFSPQPPDPRNDIPVLDDGALTPLTFPGFITTVGTCYEDPVAGVCNCVAKAAPAYSGDAVMGDGIRTLETSLTLPADPSFWALGAGCVIESRPRSALLRAPESIPPLYVTLRATDRIGNVTSTTTLVTPSNASMSCNGDACGCCLLLSRNPAAECSGLPGMPSPDIPDGLCHAF